MGRKKVSNLRNIKRNSKEKIHFTIQNLKIYVFKNKLTHVTNKKTFKWIKKVFAAVMVENNMINIT